MASAHNIISNITDWVTTPYTIYLVVKDPTVPRSAKLRAVVVLALVFLYVIGPIDLIPDFIPFAGWLDDLVVVPLGLTLLRKISPGFDILEKRAKAQAGVRRILLWAVLSLSVVVLLGLLWLGILIYVIVRFVSR
jgi:uncharacterized membrane protein YkvA (DUF1232 family)